MSTNIGALMAQLGLDTKGFKTAIKDVERDFKTFSTGVSTMAKEATRGWEDMRLGFTSLNSALKEVKTSVTSTTAAIEAQTKAVNVGNATLKAMSEVQKAQIQYQHDLNKVTQKGVDVLQKGANEWHEQTVRLGKVNTSVKTVRTALKELDTRLGTTNTLLARLGTSVLSTNLVIREQAKEITRLTRAHLQAEHPARRIIQSNEKHRASVHKLITGYRDLRTVMLSLGIGFGLRQVISELVEANTTMEALTRGFVVATGSTKAAQESMTWLRAETNRLGLEFFSVAERMKAFAAAAQGTTLEGQGVRDVFRGMLEAGRAMGLDIDRIRLSLLALEQMMSKGTVQTEELRRQLGEHLPGAFRMAAEAMGKSTRELNRMLKLGQVFAEDLIPQMADLWHEKFAKAAMDATGIAQSALARLTTAFMDLKIAIAGGSFIQEIIEKAEELSYIFRNNAEGATAFVDIFVGLASTIAEVVVGLGIMIAKVQELADTASLFPPEFIAFISGAGIGGWVTKNPYGAIAGGVTALTARGMYGQQAEEAKFLALSEEVRLKKQAEVLDAHINTIKESIHTFEAELDRLQILEPKWYHVWFNLTTLPENDLQKLLNDNVQQLEQYAKQREEVQDRLDQVNRRESQNVVSYSKVLGELKLALKDPKEQAIWIQVEKSIYEGEDPFKGLNDAIDKQLKRLEESKNKGEIGLKEYNDGLLQIQRAYNQVHDELEMETNARIDKRTKEAYTLGRKFIDGLQQFKTEIENIKIAATGAEGTDSGIDTIRAYEAAFRKLITTADSAKDFNQIFKLLDTEMASGAIPNQEMYNRLLHEAKEAQNKLNQATSGYRQELHDLHTPMQTYLETMKAIKASSGVSGLDIANAENEEFDKWVKASDTAMEYGAILDWLLDPLRQTELAQSEITDRILETQRAYALLADSAKDWQEAAEFGEVSSEWNKKDEKIYQLMVTGMSSQDAKNVIKTEEQLQKELIRLTQEGVERQMSQLDLLLEKAKEYEGLRTLITEIEAAQRVRVAQEEAEETYKVLAAGINDFVGSLAGVGDDLAGWWEDLWDRMLGIFLKAMTEIVIAWAVGMRDMTKLSASTQLLGGMFGLSGFTQATSGLSGITSAAQNSTGIFSIPGISQIGTSLFGTGLSPTMSALNPALDMSTLMALEASGAIVPGSAATTVGAYSTLSPMPPSFMSFANYGAMGGLGYSMFGDSLGLPTGIGPNIGAGAGSMAGAYGASALASAIGMELGATMMSIVPVIGTAIGAVLGGLVGSLFGGSDHTQRRADRGGEWLSSYTGIMGSEDLTSLATLPGLMLSSEFNQPYTGTIGDITRRTENEGSSAALKYTGLAGQAPKGEWMATVATMPDLNIEVANSLNEVGLATMDTVEALNNYADEIQLTSQYMEDWEEDAQAMGQAYVDYYAKLTHLTMESFLDQMMEGTLTTNEFIAALAELGTSFPDQATFIMNEMVEEMLGNLEATMDQLVSYRTAWQQANDVLQKTTQWQTTYDQGLAVLFSDIELTAEEVQNFVYMLDLTQKALAGDVDAIETMMAVGDDFSAWVGSLSTDFDLLSVNIEKARLQLLGFTDDQLQAATMATAFMNYERSQLTPSTAGGISAENPDDMLTVLSPFDVARQSMQPGGGVNWEDWQWLIDWFMDPGLSAEEFTAVSASIGIAQEDFLSFIGNIQAGLSAIEAQAAALKDSAREGITGLRSSLLDDIRQATMSDQDYASFKLDEEYAGYITQATEWSNIMGDPLTALFDLINRWYDVQKDIVEQTGMTAEEMQRAGEEWKAFVEGVQAQALNLLTTEANPQDAIERLGIAKEAITSVLGGQSVGGYLGGIEDPQARLEAAQHLQDLITTYLGTGQEAYQRPSSEYQSVFNEVIQLLGDLEAFGIDQASEYGVLVDSLSVLNSINTGIQTLIGLTSGTTDITIPANESEYTNAIGTYQGTQPEISSSTGGMTATSQAQKFGWVYPGDGSLVYAGGPFFPGQLMITQSDWRAWFAGGQEPIPKVTIPSAAVGMDRVPYDMPIFVHQNESILTADEAEEWRNGSGGDLTINNYIYESKDPQATRKMMEEVVISSLRRGRGRSVSQRNARVGGV